MSAIFASNSQTMVGFGLWFQMLHVSGLKLELYKFNLFISLKVSKVCKNNIIAENKIGYKTWNKCCKCKSSTFV